MHFQKYTKNYPTLKKGINCNTLKGEKETIKIIEQKQTILYSTIYLALKKSQKSKV